MGNPGLCQKEDMMKLYIMTDIEGVAGVFSFEMHAYPEGKYFEYARRLLTAEVNAAVEGALAAGVIDILVVDGHGAGGINYEEIALPAGAQLQIE